MALRSLEHEVPGDELLPLVEQLDEDAIEILQFRGIPAGLYRDVVVGNGSQHVDAVGELAAELQVESAVHAKVLIVAEEDAA